MLSARLNNQLKPSLILVIDENLSKSSVGFQFACCFASEIANKCAIVNILLTEHNQTNWLNAPSLSNHPGLKSKIYMVDVFDDIHSTKTIEECVMITNGKSLIIIESLPWLLLRTGEGALARLLHNWSKSHIVMAVIPVDCLEEHSVLNNLISISNATVRIKNLSKTDTVEARIEQRSRTNADANKSCLTFSIDKQLNIINLREEKLSNRKSKALADNENASKTDITANLTFNLRLKDDELVAKNNLILPFMKQQASASNDSCTIHYSYDKEDDIDEDEDDDLDL